VPVVVTSIDGADLVSNDFDAFADGWFNGGWVERANGDRRFVVSHVGDRVTLMSPFLSDLAVLDTVDAYPGCQGTEAVCTSKFNNLPNHLGFARVPGRNPHEGRIT